MCLLNERKSKDYEPYHYNAIKFNDVLCADYTRQSLRFYEPYYLQCNLLHYALCVIFTVLSFKIPE